MVSKIKLNTVLFLLQIVINTFIEQTDSFLFGIDIFLYDKRYKKWKKTPQFRTKF